MFDWIDRASLIAMTCLFGLKFWIPLQMWGRPKPNLVNVGDPEAPLTGNITRKVTRGHDVI